MQPGDSITLSSSAKLEAQWKDYTVKRSVTFSVDSLSREYDGTALVPSSFKISSGSLAEGHEAVAVYHGQQTLPGFTIEAADGTDVTDQYEINVINGSLTVKVRSEKQPITVTIRNTEKEYDGTADVTASYSITEGALLGNDTLSAKSFTGSITGVYEDGCELFRKRMECAIMLAAARAEREQQGE